MSSPSSSLTLSFLFSIFFIFCFDIFINIFTLLAFITHLQDSNSNSTTVSASTISWQHSSSINHTSSYSLTSFSTYSTSRFTLTSNTPSWTLRIARPSTWQSSLTLPTQSPPATTASRQQSSRRPSVIHSPSPMWTHKRRHPMRHPMSTSRHQSATTPSVTQSPSATWVQRRHPTSASRQQSSTSPTETQPLLFTSASSQMSASEPSAPQETSFTWAHSRHRMSISRWKSPTSLSERQTAETSEDFIDDIEYSRAGGRKLCGHHIERGCETSYLSLTFLHQIHPPSWWLKARSSENSMHHQRAAQPYQQRNIMVMNDIDNGDETTKDRMTQRDSRHPFRGVSEPKIRITQDNFTEISGAEGGLQGKCENEEEKERPRRIPPQKRRREQNTTKIWVWNSYFAPLLKEAFWQRRRKIGFWARLRSHYDDYICSGFVF